MKNLRGAFLFFAFLLFIIQETNGREIEEIESVYLKGDPIKLRLHNGVIRNFAPFQYWGGPVLSNVKLVMVQWGVSTGSNFAPYITSNQLSTFYTEIVRNSWIDWLSEYNTNTQHIGRGTFSGKYVITPSHTYTVDISDTFIETELLAQIALGHLPANDNNTLYMLHFPKGLTVSAFGMLSCVDFCAYHGTVVPGLYYAVMPDFSLSSGCSFGCGISTEFNNVCAVSSHEIAEAITDPEVGLAYDFVPPLAWYSPIYGEVADPCSGLQGSFTTSNGTRYAVQKIGSNLARNCMDNCIRSLSLSSSFINANNQWKTFTVSFDDRFCAASAQPTHVQRSLSITSTTPSRDSTDISIISFNKFRVKTAVSPRTFIITLNISNTHTSTFASSRILLSTH